MLVSQNLLLILAALCLLSFILVVPYNRTRMSSSLPNEVHLAMTGDAETATVPASMEQIVHPKFLTYGSSTRTHSAKDKDRRLQIESSISLVENQLAMSTRRRRPPFAGKKGACFTLRDEGDPKGGTWRENLPKVRQLKPYWNYSWGPKRIEKQPDNIEFVPMLWGAWSKEGLADTIETTVMPQIRAGLAKRVLVFNEPDSFTQANIPVDKAISYWPVAQTTGVPLGSPACVNAKNVWMTDFVNKLSSDTSLRMDYITVHWYGEPSAAAFKREMRSIFRYYGRRWRIWITEFAPADWSAATPEANKYTRRQILDFMKEVLPWIEQQKFIVAYSWFPFSVDQAAGTCSALFDRNGKMTALGRYYASVTNENPQGDQSIQVQ